MKSSLLLKVKNSRYYLLIMALLSALLFWLGWPVQPFSFLLFIALVPLLAIEDHIVKGNYRRPWRMLLGYTYLTTLLWNIVTTWWLYNVSKAGMIPAMGINALFMCVPVLAFSYTRKVVGDYIGYFSLILYWLAFEYVHLSWDLSWPWLTLGNGFAMFPEWIQWYEFTGALGGSVWLWMVNILFFVVLFKGDAIFRGQIRWISLTYTLLLVLLPIGFSYLTYSKYEDKGTPVEVVVMQPNIDPYTEKFVGSENFIPFPKQLERFIELSEKKITPNTEFVVWPETALDKAFNEKWLDDYKILQQIYAFKDKYPDMSLVTGMTSYTQYPSKKEASATARYRKDIGFYDVFNTAFFIGDNEDKLTYHKSRLVPGAELMPYPEVFSFLGDIMLDLGGTTGGYGRQKERTVFEDAENVKVAPAICYESVYGDFMSAFIRNGAELIFIITNDGWWGNTPGHKQHLNYAVLRAIETRRSIARSANTGVSAFINQRGDILQPTQYWTQDVIRGTIKANDELTFFARHGDFIGRNALWLSIFFFLSVLVRRKMKKVEQVAV